MVSSDRPEFLFLIVLRDSRSMPGNLFGTGGPLVPHSIVIRKIS